MNTHRVIRGLGRLADWILPPTCHSCGELVAEPQTLCADCWSNLTFLGPPCCDACGYPFDYHVADRTLCGACARAHPPFARARAALLYDERSRDLVLGYKHADKVEATVLFAKWMWAAGREMLADADVIVPIPLHWTRLFQRRYNQSALLAHGLERLSGVAVCADALVRKRNTPSQGRFGRLGRARNVKGAFAVRAKRRNALTGMRVVLVDDVYTTGATVRTATEVLKRAGCAEVDVLVLARVVRGFV